MKRAIAKDKNGIQRCHGDGATTDDAWHNCHREAWQYMQVRRDIKELHIFIDGTRREVIHWNDF